MDNLRFLYTLKIFVTPLCWLRNRKKHKEFDIWLWDALQTHSLEKVEKYSASIAGVEIWISNEPYANGYVYSDETLNCGRATALLLRDKVREVRKEKEALSWAVFQAQHGNANS